MSDLTVLDCTLRDGGYYNAWDFDRDLVQRYLDSISLSGIDAVEMGFRFPPQNKFLGPFAHASDEVISSFDLPDCLVGVMVNSADFLNENDVLDYFIRCEDSPVDLVRVATHFKDLEASIDIANAIKGLGYKVGFNIMQAAGRTDQELSDAGKMVSSRANVDVLYLADSLGNMDANNVRRSFKAIREHWHGDLGFHGHNNKREAISNTLHAMDCGVSWVDGTITGMGRGAGNTEMEYLLMELEKKRYRYKPSELWRLVLEDFLHMQDEHKWGPSLLYGLSASYGIHPTYVQSLIDAGFKPLDIWESLEYLKDAGGSSFNAEKLFMSQHGQIKPGPGGWSANKWVEDRDVILIAPGPNGKKHADEVNRYAKSNNVFVIGLNASDEIFEVDACAVCHAIRLDTEISKICERGIPILCPLSSLPEHIGSKFKSCDILDYGFTISKNQFGHAEYGCIIPSMLVALYAMAAALQGGAHRILLVGFDGYAPGDSRYDEMETALSACVDKADIDIVALTPTRYRSVKQGSIYCDRGMKHD